MSNADRHAKRHGEDPTLEEPIPTFDDARIKNNPDKVLLGRIRTYFKAFTTGDFNGIKDLESDDYTMTDIRKNIYSMPHLI